MVGTMFCRKMKILLPLGSNPWCRFGNSRVFTFWVRFHSTEALPSSSQHPTDSLHRRISRAGHPTASMAAVLDQWLDEGKHVKQSELQRFIRMLRKYRRFHHALQISEWMSDHGNHDLSPGDIGVRLDLISKVHGLEEAEKYFNSIPKSLRVSQVYGALLNCYAYKKSLEKAEAIMQKIRDLGFASKPLSYNVMLNLYFHLGKYEKLDVLLREMEEKGISYDNFTFNIQLNAYGATSNIEGMEKLLMKMEADPHFKVDWNAYVVAATHYLKAGLIEKSLAMLKRAEYLVGDRKKRFAYEILLTLYAAAGNKDEVYRIWKLHKKLGKVFNSGYLGMISSLMKLDDIDGAERILEEWESGHPLFDIRIPNVVLSGYCRNGLLEKAESYVNRLIESGKEPEATTWDRLATGYHAQGQMAKSVEIMKKAILSSQPGWKPNPFTLAACYEYLRCQEDVQEANELLTLLRERGHSVTDMCDPLLSKNLGSQALDQIEAEEQIVVDGGHTDIIELKDEGNS